VPFEVVMVIAVAALLVLIGRRADGSRSSGGERESGRQARSVEGRALESTRQKAARSCPHCSPSRMSDSSEPMFSTDLDGLEWFGVDQYCAKCGAPLWKTCGRCNGKRLVRVPLDRGEDRFCKVCGRELRRDKATVCPDCKGRGRVSTEHDVERCRGR
jgi:hypothetical protein